MRMRLLISCGIHIAIGICCPRKNCWPGFIKGANHNKIGEGEDEEGGEGDGDGLKVRSGSSESEVNKGVQGRNSIALKNGPKTAQKMAPKWNFEKGHMSQLKRVKSKKGPKNAPKNAPEKGPKN